MFIAQCAIHGPSRQKLSCSQILCKDNVIIYLFIYLFIYLKLQDKCNTFKQFKNNDKRTTTLVATGYNYKTTNVKP